MPQAIHTLPRHDSDIGKGAFEAEEPRSGRVSDGTNTSLSGQLGHRNRHEYVHGEDTDFPEPDAHGEHSGQIR
jgi:hypothetical protein